MVNISRQLHDRILWLSERGLMRAHVPADQLWLGVPMIAQPEKRSALQKLCAIGVRLLMILEPGYSPTVPDSH